MRQGGREWPGPTRTCETYIGRCLGGRSDFPGPQSVKTSKRGRRKRAGPCRPGRVAVPSARVPPLRRRFHSTPTLGSFHSWFRKRVNVSIMSFCRIVTL